MEMDKTNQDMCIHVEEKQAQNPSQVHSRVHDEEELAKQIKKKWTVSEGQNCQESVVLKSKWRKYFKKRQSSQLYKSC